MKSLITKISIKIIFIVLFCLGVSICTSALAPVITNNIALGQLQNDDMAFAVMEVWNQIQNYIAIGEITIITIVILTILYDVCKYLIGRKENIHYEKNN